MICLHVSAVAAERSPEPGTGIEGLITIGPIHGGPARPGVPDSRPMSRATFIVENERGTITSFLTDDDGRFRVSLSPGHYRVSFEHAQPKVGHYGPFEAEVVAGQMTKVEWHCNSGRQ